jgi:hypothetical protein
MKKILLFVMMMSVCFACDVLDVKPTNAIPAADAFKDKKGIEKGVRGAYTSFQGLSYYGRTFLIFSDLAADNLENPIDGTALDYRQVDNNNILPENGAVGGIWNIAYEGINTANNVIDKVPGIADMTEAEKNNALGELYFIRALNHFNLVNLFGAIPLKTSPTVGVTNLNAPRRSVDDVYSQIISDLQFAETNITNTTKNRASRYAAKALLARVYLYHGDYALAAAKATEVINGPFSLPAYDVVFGDDGSAETIFEIDFTDLVRNRIAEYNFPKTLNGRREVAPTAELLAAYEAGDDRYDASLAFAGQLPYAIKYDDLSIGADNVIVLRLAEMYLIRAEALARTAGNIQAIRDDIDVIRNRANLPDTPANTHADLLRVIEKERRVEFAFEGHRWFDLVRTERAIDVLPNVKNANQTLFPIPLAELLTNSDPQMTQNPGY